MAPNWVVCEVHVCGNKRALNMGPNWVVCEICMLLSL